MALTIQQIRERQNQQIERDPARFSALQDAREQGVQNIISTFNEYQSELARLEKEKEERRKRLQTGTATPEDREALIQVSKNAAFKSDQDISTILARNETISAPQQAGVKDGKLVDNNVSYKRKLETQLTKLADTIPLFGPLFGSSERKRFITEDSSLGQQFLAEGAYGVLFGNLLMPPEDKVTRDYADLVATGVDKSTANKLAAWRHGFGEIDFKPTAMQLDTLRDASKERAIWSLLEAADVVTLGRATGAAEAVVKRTVGLDKYAFANALKGASTRSEMRDLLIERYPQLKGTQELERIMDLGEKIQSNPIAFDSEISASARQGKQVLKESVVADTEAQKALFRTGTPLLKTVAGNADEVVDVRRSITSVLRGEREATRLSQPDVLASEIRAGSLPKNSTPESTVEVFRVGGSGRRVKVGDQVTLSKELAGEGADSFRVPVKDLVRLEDGTFARVPEAQIGKDLTPSINAVRDTVTREKVIAREQAEKTRLEMERIAREQAEKRAKQEAIEREARDEAIRLDKEAKLMKAREVAESAKTISRGDLTKMKNEAIRASRKIDATEKKIVKVMQTRTALLKASTAKAGLTAGRFVQKFGDYMTVAEKNKVRAGKALTAAERTRIQKRVRDAMDKEIDALKATKDELQSSWRKAGADLVNAKKTLKEAEEAKKVLAEAGEGVKVKNKTTPVKLFHGTDNTFDSFDNMAEGAGKKTWTKNGHISFSTSSKVSKTYGKNVKPYFVDEGKQMVVDAGGKYWNQVEFRGEKMLVDDIAKIAQDEGFDSVRIKNVVDVGGKDPRTVAKGIEPADTVVVFDASRVSNKPVKEATTKATATKLKPVGSGEKTESTLSQRLIKKAKEAGKDISPDINTPFYNKATNSEYIKDASEYLSKNGVDKSIDAIMDMADEAVPQQIKPALYNAILDTVERTGTPEQIQRMVAALSNISEEGTAAGQIVESLKALHRNNPVMRILNLQSTLREIVTRKLGKKAFTEAEEELFEQVAKAGTKEDAMKVVDDLTC